MRLTYTGLNRRSYAMYPALARLADDGLLEHRWELPSENGRPRHRYRLTAEGLRFAASRP